MSIAFANKLRELEARLNEQRAHNVELAERVSDLVARVAVLEAERRKTKKPE